MKWQRWLSALLLLFALGLLVQSEGPPPQDVRANLDYVTAGWTFNFLDWEIEALSQKVLYGLLAPHRYMDDEAQAQFVLDYLADVREADRLAWEIDKIYTDPEVEDPVVASRQERDAFAALRQKLNRHAPVAEAIVEDQVSSVLADVGLGSLASIFPPVSGTFTPLPHILVISPRDRIESAYQRQLIAGLTAADQTILEDRVTGRLDDHSAYVTAIGGLAAYPAMLLEIGSIDWVADVVAHEWTHHFLALRPLGWQYMTNGEARTINETTASLIGEWAGQEVILRYYASFLERGKSLPNPLTVEPSGDGDDVQPAFDFRAEMHHTRVIVDQLLAEGRIKEAEWYMEARRRYFVANGYQLRRLNQAYFAFHGAYASAPGASGEDPIGPLVRRAWAVSPSPAAFLREMSPVTSLGELRAQVSG
ncbi:MAG: hypothetical protein ACP5JG_14525 [Anaerolineae bacterium]